MNKIYIFLIVVLSFSCTGKEQKKQFENEVVEKEKLSKLEQLMLLPRDSVMVYYDLSNDSISEFPDLSDYTIKSLDLSYNLLDTIIVNYFPKEMVSLDLSNNLLNGFLWLKIDDDERLDWKKLYNETTLREINLSHNNLSKILITFPLRKIVVSYNDMTYVEFNHGNIEYLDISNNPNLSNVIQFDPYVIDTIIRDNIANDKELVPSNWYPGHIDYIIPDDSIK